MRKVIIIGATSGIGRALAVAYAKLGWQVGITGRRTARLEELKLLFPGKYCLKTMDLQDCDGAAQALRELIAEMQSVDLIIVNAGMGHVNTDLDWAIEQDCIAVNVRGFAAMCNVAMNYFLARGQGHLAGVSSVAAVRGIGGAPAYSASKAFVVNYLESLRGIAVRRHANIVVTNIQPGFVDTVMGQSPKAFWRASPELAAAQIVAGLQRGATQLYVTKRWRIVAWLMRVLPESIVNRIG